VDLVSEFDEPTAIVVKHTNPCGAASNSSLVQAYIDARETDPVSAFGGIVSLNRSVDLETAKELSGTFLEVVVAPDFAPEALEKLKEKKNIRLMKMPIPISGNEKRYEFRSVAGGVLRQEKDAGLLGENGLKVVTGKAPTESQMAALLFAWKVAKHVKSNAIIFSEEGRLVAVGAGQMSRVDSSRVAVAKATRSVQGSSMASDAFFPFRDAVDEAAKAGVSAIIQPGGSVRDQEVIDAANEHGISMVFTGMRHFKH
ncbi:MAG: bifunctional phosphoribosylaminoimidazolecarboxamide formyltransferase/IMP cyclohydrolase, partial [Nitrospinota bacterium]